MHGNDTLYGGSGADYIEGNGRDDIIYGGDGNDHLWGDRHHDAVSRGIINSRSANNHLNFQFHGNDLVDAMSIGMMTPGEVDDSVARIKKALQA